MVRAQQATFTPSPTGGDIKADLQVGNLAFTTNSAIEDASEAIRDLLDELVPRVEHVTFTAALGATEIRVNLKVGDRNFMTALRLEGANEDLRPQVDSLLQEIATEGVRDLQSALEQDKIYG